MLVDVRLYLFNFLNLFIIFVIRVIFHLIILFYLFFIFLIHLHFIWMIFINLNMFRFHLFLYVVINYDHMLPIKHQISLLSILFDLIFIYIIFKFNLNFHTFHFYFIVHQAYLPSSFVISYSVIILIELIIVTHLLIFLSYFVVK